MNYTGCFNRSRGRAAISLQPVFYFLRPFWCPRWHQAWSIATAAHLRPSGALVGIRHGVLPRLHICARSGALVGIRHGVLPRLHICAHLVPTTLHYTHYTISQILGILQPSPLQAAHYGSYRASQILGNCKQTLINIYILFLGVK